MKAMRRLRQRIQEYTLYVVLYLLPFSTAAVEIGFGVLFIAWLIDRIDPAERRQTLLLHPALKPVWTIGACFLAIAAVSVFLNVAWLKHLRGLIDKWVEYLLYALIVADLAGRKAIARRAIAVVIVSSLAVVLEGITQELFGHGLFRGFHIGPGHTFSRMVGPYTNPIDLATYIMFVIPLVIAQGLKAGRSGMRWVIPLVLVDLACLIRTQAAGTWLALIAGVIAMALVYPPIRRYALVMLVAGALVGSGVLHRSGRLLGLFSLSEAGTADRILMWQDAIGMWRDRPWFGHGPNSFMSHYLDYWVGGERQPRYAHNCYLQMAAETGIIGGLLFVWLLGSIMGKIHQALRLPGAQEFFVLLGMFGALIAAAAHAAVDTDFYTLRQSALFWIVSGLALGLAHVIGKDKVVSNAAVGGRRR